MVQGADEARSKLMELLGQGRPLEPLERLQASLPPLSSGVGSAPAPPADQPWTVAVVGLQLLNSIGQVAHAPNRGIAHDAIISIIGDCLGHHILICWQPQRCRSIHHDFEAVHLSGQMQGIACGPD